MKVIILAAGRGSRLGKFTENLPKSFVKRKIANNESYVDLYTGKSL